MAKTTAEERRLRWVGKAERAAERAKARRLDADYAERGGRLDEAAAHRAAADRHDAQARQHAQEAARLAERARAGLYRTDPKAKARQAVYPAAMLRSAVSDCLDGHASALAEIEAIEREIRRLDGVLSRLPPEGAETQRARLQAQIAAHEGWALEWKREAERLAPTSRDNAGPSSRSVGSPAPP